MPINQARVKVFIITFMCTVSLMVFIAFDQGFFEPKSESITHLSRPQRSLPQGPISPHLLESIASNRNSPALKKHGKASESTPHAFRFIKANPQTTTASDTRENTPWTSDIKSMIDVPLPKEQQPTLVNAFVVPTLDSPEYRATAQREMQTTPNSSPDPTVVFPNRNYAEQSRLTMAAAQSTTETTNAPSTNNSMQDAPPPIKSETLPPPLPPVPSKDKPAPAKDSSKASSDDKQKSDQKSENKTPEQIGVPPPRPQPEFLRDTSVLLEPGQYQFETGIAYTSITRDSVISQLREEEILVANLRTVSRNLQVPLEFRVGLTKDMQGSISLPIGFANQTVSVANASDSEDTWGIGDLSAGITKVLYEGKKGAPNVLGNIAIVAPTAETSFPAAQQAPGATLGNGFWVFNVGLNAVKTLDPIAIFGGMSYSYTFETSLPNGLVLDAGNIISYRLGIGYAINSRVALSGAFEGNYIGELMVDGRKLSGSVREPFSVRLAATIQSDSSNSTKSKLRRKKSSEPFVRFGLSEGAPDANFGIRWTY